MAHYANNFKLYVTSLWLHHDASLIQQVFNKLHFCVSKSTCWHNKVTLCLQYFTTNHSKCSYNINKHDIVRVVWSQAIVNSGGRRGTVSRGVNAILIHTAVLQRGRWYRGDLFHNFLFLYDSQAKQQVCSVSRSDMSCPVCVCFTHMFHHPLLLSQACALRESGWSQEQQAVIGRGCYVR